jgi:hypothetical protein
MADIFEKRAGQALVFSIPTVLRHNGPGKAFREWYKAEGNRRSWMKPLRNICDRIWGQFIGEVPEDHALCEYDCRKPQCTEGEWENCMRRLERAAGELMPAKETSF